MQIFLNPPGLVLLHQVPYLVFKQPAGGAEVHASDASALRQQASAGTYTKPLVLDY